MNRSPMAFTQDHRFLPPIGMVVAYISDTPPQGWVICDGTSYAKSQYPQLYSVIGHTYDNGAADPGDGTFKVPDCRQRVILGFGATPGGTLGATAGGIDHVHTLSGTSDAVSHVHNASGTEVLSTAGVHTHDSHTINALTTVAGVTNRLTGPTTHSSTGTGHNHNASGITGLSGTEAAHTHAVGGTTTAGVDNYQTFNWIIRAEGIDPMTPQSRPREGRDFLPLGSIVSYTQYSPDAASDPLSQVVPPNPSWLRTSGLRVSKSEYAELYALMGHTYETTPGVDPGTGGFKLPETQGRHLLGKAQSGTGSTLGTATGTASDVFTHIHTAIETYAAGSSHTHSGVGTLTTATGGQHNHDAHTEATNTDNTGTLQKVTIPVNHDNTGTQHTHNFVGTSAADAAHTHTTGSSTANAAGSYSLQVVEYMIKARSIKVVYDYPRNGGHTLIPPGTVACFAGPEAKIPFGWLLCDGSFYAQSQYAELFRAIGFTFTTTGSRGADLGDGTFRVPHLDGRVGGGRRHLSGSGSFPGDLVSSLNHTHGNFQNIVSANTGSHTHGVGTITTDTAAAHNHDAHTGNTTAKGGGGANRITSTGQHTNDGSHSHTLTDGLGTGSSAHIHANSAITASAQMGPYIVLCYIIKT